MHSLTNPSQTSNPLAETGILVTLTELRNDLFCTQNLQQIFQHFPNSRTVDDDDRDLQIPSDNLLNSITSLPDPQPASRMSIEELGGRVACYCQGGKT